jgi:hypothetical protein
MDIEEEEPTGAYGMDEEEQGLTFADYMAAAMLALILAGLVFVVLSWLGVV